MQVLAPPPQTALFSSLLLDPTKHQWWLDTINRGQNMHHYSRVSDFPNTCARGCSDLQPSPVIWLLLSLKK